MGRIASAGGGFAQRSLKAAPAVTIGTYAAGNCVGGKITLSNGSGLSGIIQSVKVWDKNGNTLQLDAVFFDADPSASTLTDKVNVTIASADLAKVIGVAHLGDFFKPTTGGAITQALDVALDYVVTGALYCALVAQGAVAYASISDIALSVGIAEG